MNRSGRPPGCRTRTDRTVERGRQGGDPGVTGTDTLLTDGGERTQCLDACEELRGATRQLVGVTDRARAAEIAVAGIEDVLSFDFAGLWLSDDTGCALEPAVVVGAGERFADGAPTYSPEEGLAGNAFQTNTVRVVDDLREHEAQHGRETAVRSELVVPLGEHGLLRVGARETGAFTDADVSCLELWAETLTVVFGRLERERTLRARERALQRERARLEEVASVVSHDLRNPLNVATGRLELVERECDSEHVPPAQRGLDKMERLIANLVVLVREGAVVDDTEPVGLAALADNCWETVQRSDTTLSVTADCTVRADGDRLAEVLENLFENAVEHGGDDVTVRVGELDDGFYVADDGRGIDEDARAEVFEAGYSTGRGGTGLGLAIVHRIVEAHGWSVRTTDSDDDGARIEITGVDTA